MARAKVAGDDQAAAELDAMADRCQQEHDRLELEIERPWPQGMSQEQIESGIATLRAMMSSWKQARRMLRNRAGRLRNGTAH